MRKTIALIAFACAAALAQDGPTTVPSEGPPNFGWQVVYTVNGSNQTTAICYARASLDNRRQYQVSIASISKASAAVVTATAHGIHASSRPIVTISGATGTGWTAVNGSFVATVVDANSFSIPVNSTGFGTLGGTITFTTTAPLTNLAQWAVQKIDYDVSGNVIWRGWLGGSATPNQKCSDGTSTSVQQQ